MLTGGDGFWSWWRWVRANEVFFVSDWDDRQLIRRGWDYENHLKLVQRRQCHSYDGKVYHFYERPGYHGGR